MVTLIGRPVPVILSFTAILDELAAGRVNKTDLEDTIMYLGCERDFVERTSMEILVAQLPRQTEDVTEQTVEMLREVIKKARRDGRVIWRREHGSHESRKKLNAALSRAGALPLDEDAPLVADNSTLKKAIEQANRAGPVDLLIISN